MGQAQIARVAVDMPLGHLDRCFDYQVPPAMAAEITVGVRVRVRFAGRLVDGYVLELADTTDFAAKLAKISTLVSAEPVLSPKQIALIRAVADHYAGTFFDVARLAVPARHASVEKALPSQWPAAKTSEIPTEGLTNYPGGTRLLEGLGAAEPLRAHWQVNPRYWMDDQGRDDWVRGIIQASVATLRSDRGVIIALPDAHDIAEVRDRLAEVIGLGAIAELHSDLGKAARYRNYLAIRRGQAQIVVGARAALYAPVTKLGLIVVWDDGDDLFADKHAPYPHGRTVAALRSAMERTALLFGSHGRSSEIQSWIERGWLASLSDDPATRRRVCAAVRVSSDSDQALDRDPRGNTRRLPQEVFNTIRNGLTQGPVLVQVPRAGYLPALTCQNCRHPLRCPHCQGPVQMTRAEQGRRLDCGWCGRIVSPWNCPECGSTQIRAVVVGAGRTTEELGRAFPGFNVIESTKERRRETVSQHPALVVATPGAEPLATGGYAAAVLLDTHRLLDRADLRAGEEALRRWLNAIALVRPAGQGGSVLLVGDSSARAIQAVVRLDPGGFAGQELADRRQAGFPPAVVLVSIEAESAALRSWQNGLEPPESTEILGPIPLPSERDGTEVMQLTLRAPLADGRELTKAVKAAQAVHSAKKTPGAVRLCVDPVHI